jgi:hypothetical protein
MSCDVKYEDIIFIIEKISRINKSEYYVFIGNNNENIDNILKKLEKRENISSDEVRILKNNFPNDYKNWIDLIKKKFKVFFIPNKIHIDDSISEIRKKIFIYLSNPETKEYIIPENQELWIKQSNGKYDLLGYYYENEKNDKIDIKPHIYQEFIYDNVLNDNFVYIEKKINTSENNWLIYDLIDLKNSHKNIIYLSNAKDEELFLKNKRINISKEFINQYFKKYWHYVNLNFDVNEIKNNYLLLKEYYSKEEYIFNIIDCINKKDTCNTKLLSLKNNSNIIGSCNILTVKLSVNPDNYLGTNNNDKNEIYDYDKYVDLYQIFDYIRDKKIDIKTPFLRYSEDILDSPFTIISKEALNKNIVKKDTLKKWFGLKKDEAEQRKMSGILIKRYLRDYNNEPRFSQVIIKKTGNIGINVSFSTENNASFKDIEIAVKDCKKFIDDINKNRIIKKINEKQLINPPDLNIKDNEIILKKNTKIMFMNIVIPINLKTKIDFKKLLEFSKKFPYFLTEIPEDPSKSKTKLSEVVRSLDFKYKRVSGFANMNKILERIDILKQNDEKDIIILKILEKEFQKSEDELKGYLLEWKKKYSSSKTKKIASQFKTGFLITISDESILIRGITDIYHIPLLHNFFVTFLTLFINYDNFTKDKDFKKFFMSKNLNSLTNSNSKYFENTYLLNNNVKIDMENIYDMNYNYNTSNLILNEDLDFSGKEYEEEIMINNMINGSLPEGLATDEEIGKDVQLVCDDPIPEKDTCKDFCNDQKYFLRRLQRYDNKLFKSYTDKKDKLQYSFARKCQQQYQPVILPYDPNLNDNINKDSYSYSIKYGSNPEEQRWYICPKIWCPYCEIPISESDINKSTIRVRATKDENGAIRGTCKVASCPNGDHQVFIRETDGEKPGLYPGFLSKSFHPLGLCLPCCFKLPQNNPKSSSYKSFKKCIGEDVENNNIKDGQIYILDKSFTIDKDRYGKLPLEIARILKTKLDSGYLKFNSGYLRKGIQHERNNSFLSCICDIVSCNKVNSKIDILKIKNILVDKLNENIFRSLYGGNLPNIFHNPKKNISALDNYKNFILNGEVEIDHTYLWDLLQRPNILFESGVNIFIFENNNLLCPTGENSNYFYSREKNNVLIIKNKKLYEPIYYLEGDGKGAKKTCIFNYDKEEIEKIYELSLNGCKSQFQIEWIDVLKDNIKKYDINIDNVTISDGYDLQKTLNEILINIKNKKLDKSFIPVLQYVDNYNKTFGIKLENGLYYPIKPSKLIEQINYKVISDVSEIDKIDFKNIIKYTNEIIKNTNLGGKFTHKVLDIKEGKYIIALVNEFNRFVPINKIGNSDKTLKISSLNYYSDINKSINENIENYDKRVELMNKKNFEDETYMRMRFELSKFIQLKENKKYLDDIFEIINSSDKNIQKNRTKMYEILNKIYSKITTIEKNSNVDYYNYKTPNKRIPCFLRKINENKKTNKKIKTSNNNSNEVNFLCEDDPHCYIKNKSCKLFINYKNLLDSHKNFNNYDYYIAKIVDEILRFKMKRNEILYDNVENIINKELIQERPNKYVIIHTLNNNEINNEIEKLFLDTKGVYIDNRNLYEEISTKEVGFKLNKYIKTDIYSIKNNKIEDLSGYWEKILSNKFKVKLSEDNNIFKIIEFVLNILKNSGNDEIDIISIKNEIIKYLKNITTKYKNLKINEEYLLEFYKKHGNKIFKYVTSFSSLLEEILNDNYYGSELELEYISEMYKLNIIILDKRIKKDSTGFKIYKPYTQKSNNYILLYKSIVFENNFYNLIQNKNKYIFQLNDFPEKFIKNFINKNKANKNNNQ